MAGTPSAIWDCQAGIQIWVEEFNRICNTRKEGSKQNQEATSEVIKDNLLEK
ncbi:uncharacterized protein H6S33_008556, partial [Morchella sextelata]|uniref:uncharacterized protein n=1 Tax=Morchella sextelata TaxID=1174677 RepID=UPI001D04781F